MNELLAKPWVRRAGFVLGIVVAVYAMVYVDLVLRARSAYLEGERFMAWHAHPEQKKAFHDALLAEETAALAAELASGKLDKDAHELRMELARFKHEEALSESSVKYAYVWFQSAAELFSPPDSKYVVLARARMAEAKELWKQELRSKGIPFEDYMLE